MRKRSYYNSTYVCQSESLVDYANTCDFFLVFFFGFLQKFVRPSIATESVFVFRILPVPTSDWLTVVQIDCNVASNGLNNANERVKKNCT